MCRRKAPTRRAAAPASCRTTLVALLLLAPLLTALALGLIAFALGFIALILALTALALGLIAFLRAFFKPANFIFLSRLAVIQLFDLKQY